MEFVLFENKKNTEKDCDTSAVWTKYFFFNNIEFQHKENIIQETFTVHINSIYDQVKCKFVI